MSLERAVHVGKWPALWNDRRRRRTAPREMAEHHDDEAGDGLAKGAAALWRVTLRNPPGETVRVSGVGQIQVFDDFLQGPGAVSRHLSVCGRETRERTLEAFAAPFQIRMHGAL